MSVSGKKIILAVSGSIAAYKTPELVRQLVKAGAEVKVIATSSALDFVAPLSLATVSKNPVITSVHDGASWNNHVALGLWADALVIAPCTAHMLARLAAGLCDTVVNAVYLSARCPVFIAPAMDEDMWQHPSTRRNLKLVRGYGNEIIPVGHGELASGLTGEGRMAEPEAISDRLSAFFGHKKVLTGKKVLITAGPTYERLDPVRFIGNFSSGKMGIALAKTFAGAGAEVALVLGPGTQTVEQPDIRVLHVESAQQMYDACMEDFATTDIAILSAAVADYRPVHMAAEKIKKKEDSFSLELERTPDILASLGRLKKENQLLAGFALETNNELEHATGKLSGKNADLIVLNSMRDAGAGFGGDTNKVTLITHAGPEAHPLMSKTAVAEKILEKIIQLSYEKVFA